MVDESLPPDEGEQGGEVAPAIETVETPQEAAPASLEDLAGEMGWTPREQWRGNPDAWKPADQFVKSTVDVNQRLVSKLKSVEDQLAHVARTSAQLTERAVADARQKILDERTAAFETGDLQAFNKADKELAQLQPIAPLNPPEVNDFVARNASWFQKDQEATRWAITRADELSRQGLGPARQVAIVEREAKQMFPEFFEQAATPPRPALLNKPGHRGGTPQAKGFASLPKEAQAAALEYERRGVCPKEEYAKTYFEEMES